MIYIGIDISKYKHDCFICKDTGEVIVENLSFDNNKKGFQQFLDLLKPYDNSNAHIGLSEFKSSVSTIISSSLLYRFFDLTILN